MSGSGSGNRVAIEYWHATEGLVRCGRVVVAAPFLRECHYCRKPRQPHESGVAITYDGDPR